MTERETKILAGLTAELERRGWNQAELAKRLGVNACWISKIRCHGPVSSALIAKLARVFDVSMERAFRGEFQQLELPDFSDADLDFLRKVAALAPKDAGAKAQMLEKAKFLAGPIA